MYNKEKQIAGEKAVDFIEEGMTLGLGTGSTVYYSILKIGELVKKGFKVKAVSTSSNTTKLALSLGINVLPLDSVETIDLAIDGADEIDRDFNAIKGGGGALLYEKIVASLAKRVIWVVDSSKIVKNWKVSCQWNRAFDILTLLIISKCRHESGLRQRRKYIHY